MGQTDSVIPRQVLEWLPLFARQCSWQRVRFSGGFSGSQLWRAECVAGSQTEWLDGASPRVSRPFELCLRAWPEAHPNAERLAWIHAHLFRAKGLGLLAVPILGSDGNSFLHAAQFRWELAPWLPGKPIAMGQAQESQVVAGMQAIARLHQVWSNERTEPRLAPAWLDRRHLLDRWLDPVGSWLSALEQAKPRKDLPPLALQRQGERGIRGEFESWETLRQRALSLLPWFLAQANLELERWESHLEPLQPVLRDLWSEHVLFDEQGQVSGVIDYGAMRFDSIATDLGRLLGSWVEERDSLWQVGQRAYAQTLQVDERSLDSTWQEARSLEFIGLGLGLGNWLRWIWLDGKTFDDWPAIASRMVKQTERLERRWPSDFQGPFD